MPEAHSTILDQSQTAVLMFLSDGKFFRVKHGHSVNRRSKATGIALFGLESTMPTGVRPVLNEMSRCGEKR